MSMGKSFVELDTRRAVETEFGRGLLGRMPKRLSGEYGEEVRKRMDMWKASVEAVQRITVEYISYVSVMRGVMRKASVSYGRTCIEIQWVVERGGQSWCLVAVRNPLGRTAFRCAPM